MSAFIVSQTHLEGMLLAGLSMGRRRHLGPLRWYWPAVGAADSGAFQAGEPWGPEAGRIGEERRRELTDSTVGRVGAMLWAENRRSVDHRYAESELEPAFVWPYGRLRPALSINPVVVLKAISCFEYQSCEHPDWPTSEAFAFCDALRGLAVDDLEGMSDAPGWELRDVHELEWRPRRAERAS